MAKYEKWLGAGLGWIVTGNPLGGLLGFLAGTAIERNREQLTHPKEGISDLEANLLVLAAHLIKTDGKVSLEEINFTHTFLDTHFDERFSTQRKAMLNYCLQQDQNLTAACDQLRMYTEQGTRVQVVRFLFDLAQSDGELTERENYFIFKIAGYFTIHDVDFRKIKEEQTIPRISEYELLGISRESDEVTIRNAYRKLVIQYHPDRNTHLPEEEVKKLATRFQQIKEAYEQIKKDRRF